MILDKLKNKNKKGDKNNKVNKGSSFSLLLHKKSSLTSVETSH